MPPAHSCLTAGRQQGARNLPTSSRRPPGRRATTTLLRPSALFRGGGGGRGSSNPKPPSAQKNWLESAAAALFSASPSLPSQKNDAPLVADPADADPPFSEWLARELKVPPQPTVLVERPGAGRGLVAARPIARGELAAFIPREAAITAAVAARESPLLRRAGGGGGGGLAPDLPDWTALAVWLAEQKHSLEQQEGEGSRWAPYVSRLPAWGAMGTVLEWGGEGGRPAPAAGGGEDGSSAARSTREEQVARELAGSGLRHKAAEILRAADATWREVERAAAEAGGDQGRKGGPYTRAQIEWALAVLLSRVVRLDGAPGAPSALVPWCDFLNHSPAAGCYLDEEEGGGGGSSPAAVVGVRADRAYRRGEEVFISYGPKSSGELLLSYGFAPPPAQNAQNDRAFVQVAVGGVGGGGGGSAGKEQQQQQQRQGEAKRRALARRGIPPVENFALRADALPEGLLEYVAFADADVGSDDGEEGADAAAEALAAAIFDGDGDGDGGGGGGGGGGGATSSLLPSPELEATAWRGVAARCRQALADYVTDEAADRELAASAPGIHERGASAADPGERRALLAEVRLRERRILGAAMFAATSAGKARRRR